MLSLEMLDVVIGLIFIYLLLSLICSAINEFVESFLKLRAVDLEQGIRELLNDPTASDLAPKIYNHQLINSLFRGTYDAKELRNATAGGKNTRYSRGTDLPSYIPSRNFALALMDVLLPPALPVATAVAPPAPLNLSGSSAALAPHIDNLPAPAGLKSPVSPNPLASLRTAVSALKNTRVKNALLTIIDAAGDNAVKAREGIENWYNSSMDRVSGWYKRRVQKIVFVMGFLVAISLNADTFAIFKNLANDRPLRSAIVVQAQNFKDPKTDSSVAVDRIRGNVNALLNMGLPIGWGWRSLLNNDNNAVSNYDAIPPATLLNWILKVIGWIFTGFAVSLGAPFWFDILNKVMVVRGTVKPTEKSPDEASEDRKK